MAPRTLSASPTTNNCVDCLYCKANAFRQEIIFRCLINDEKIIKCESVDDVDEVEDVTVPDWCPLKKIHD